MEDAWRLKYNRRLLNIPARSSREIGVLRHSDIHFGSISQLVTFLQSHTYNTTVAYNYDMFRAIFLDRDGVLIENREDYVREWSHVKILPKALDALAGFPALGFKVIVVTNQSAVGRGIITIETAQEINRRLVKSIKESGGEIEAVYMCPHKPEDHCNCRKPQPGLLLQAARELSVDLASSWMVGDAWSDLLAGHSAGLSRVAMVKTGRGASQLLQNQPKEMKSFLIAEDLFNAFQLIAASQRNTS